MSILRCLILSGPIWLLPPANCALRVGHQPEYSAFFVADSCYVMERAIRVEREPSFGVIAVLVAVAENKQVFIVEPFEEWLFFFSGEKKSTFRMCDRNSNYRVFLNLTCEYAFSVVLLFQVDPATIIPLRDVRGKGSLRDGAYSVEAWKQTIFHENLEAVADSEDEPPFLDVCSQFFA